MTEWDEIQRTSRCLRKRPVSWEAGRKSRRSGFFWLLCQVGRTPQLWRVIATELCLSPCRKARAPTSGIGRAVPVHRVLLSRF